MNVRAVLLAVVVIGAVAPLFTGCATITRGTSEVLVVETEPSGASVRLSNGMVGTTPTSFKIPRKGNLRVTIIKQGFEVVEVNVNTQVAGAGAAGMAGNVLVGGIIGVGIDSFSGGTLEHKPNPVKVTLVALPSEVVATAAVAVPNAPAEGNVAPVSEPPGAPPLESPPVKPSPAEASNSEIEERPTA